MREVSGLDRILQKKGKVRDMRDSIFGAGQNRHPLNVWIASAEERLDVILPKCVFVL